MFAGGPEARCGCPVWPCGSSWSRAGHEAAVLGAYFGNFSVRVLGYVWNHILAFVLGGLGDLLGAQSHCLGRPLALGSPESLFSLLWPQELPFGPKSQQKQLKEHTKFGTVSHSICHRFS